MKIFSYPTLFIEENVYIYYDEKTKDAVIIDPGGQPNKAEDFLNEKGLNLCAILLTHGHFDHTAGVSYLKNLYDVPVIIYKDEAKLLGDCTLNLSKHMSKKTIELEADILLNDFEEFKFGNCTLKAIHTPGHTSGGVCYLDPIGKNMFTGDTLFFESIGRSDLPTGNSNTLSKSIKNKLFTLSNEINVFPGHGPKTTIGYEKINNKEL